MHRTGHYGASLVAYAPVGFVLAALGVVELAVGGAAVVVAGAMIPDWDQRVPFISHRGPTHTVWFALLVGGVYAAIGAILGSSVGVGGIALFGLVGGAVGVATIVGHLLGDVLTPMGIRPFKPMSSASYSLGVAKAANPIANYALLVIGVAAIAVAFSFAEFGVLLGAVIGVSMVANLVIAGFFGAVIPLVLDRLDQDPATSATIFITTATDVLGFFVFLGLARTVLL